MVANAQTYWQAVTLATDLVQAMESRAVIEQAKGMIMMIHKVDAEEAFDQLRLSSQAQNRKLRDVTQNMVREALDDGDE